MKKSTKAMISAAAAGAVGGYLYLIAPRLSKRSGMSQFREKVFAHRGISGGSVRENSLEAFENAASNGYGIELDVRLSSDGQAIVYHDPTLARLFGENTPVSSLSAEMLQRTYDIPTLADALEIIDGRVPVLVELKCDDRDISICPIALDVLSSYEGAYAVQSFNPMVLRWMKKYAPEVIRGQLSTSFAKEGVTDAKYLIIEHLLSNCITKPDYIAYDHKHAGNLSLNICRKLYHTPTFAWTLRSSEEWGRCADKFDSYICEDLPKKHKH